MTTNEMQKLRLRAELARKGMDREHILRQRTAAPALELVGKDR